MSPTYNRTTPSLSPPLPLIRSGEGEEEENTAVAEMRTAYEEYFRAEGDNRFAKWTQV